MNKLKQKIFGAVTAAAVALGSLGALPDIPPLSGLIVPAYADSGHTHDDIDFEAWDWDNETKLPNAPGSYYLNSDVTLGSSWNVPGGTVNLDLNGHYIKLQNGNESVISINNESSVLNLYDCKATSELSFDKHSYTINDSGLAVIDNTYSTESGHETFIGGYITGGNYDFGGGVFVYRGTFNMFGGTIIGNTAPNSGGGVCNKSTFTMSGGNIIGNTAPNSGGVYNESTFTMSGGIICGNTASGFGGGVCNYDTFTMSGGNIIDNTSLNEIGGVCNNDTFTMSGGTISGNTAQNNVGGVNGNIKISGAPVIDNNTADGKANNAYVETLTVTDALTDGAKIGVTMYTPGTFTSGLSGKLPSGKTAADIFKSDDSDYEVTTENSEAKLVGSSSSHTHNDITFKKWTSSTSLPGTSGRYYLTEDVTLDSTWTAPAGSDISLDLNGHFIKLNSNSGSVIRVDDIGAKLDLYDCKATSADAADKHSYAINSSGLAVIDSTYSTASGHKTFTGGCITGGCDDTGYGGGVHIGFGTFNMYGGTIIGNSTNISGGGVYIVNGKFAMSGGSITGNTANYGGGVYVKDNQTFTMTGGTISGNTANSGYGGGVYAYVGSTFNVSGAPKITGNVKGTTASNVYLNSDTIKVTGDLTADANICISMDIPREIAVPYVHTITEDDAAAFKSDRAGLKVVLNNGKVELVHEHIFTYALNDAGDTVTATCSGTGCDLDDNKATLTIAAPTGDIIYDSTAKAATLSGNTTAFGSPTISYSKKTGTSTWGTATTTAPTDAGTYKASVTVGSDTGAKTSYVQYTIAKATPQYTEPTGLTATYGDKLSAVGLTDGWSWDTPNASVGDASETAKTFAATFTPTDTTNYNTVTKDLEVTVNKATYGDKTINASIKFGTSKDISLSGVACTGAVFGTLGITDTDSVLSETPTVSNNKLTVALKDDENNKNKTATVTIPVTATNYNDYSITVTITVIDCTHATTELRDVVAATCLEGGYSGDSYCTNCGIKLADGHATSALGHSYSSKITTEPTCTTSGVRTYTCTRCGAVTSETITALGHDYQTYRENEVPATCTDKGSYEDVVKCSRCGKEKSRKAHTTEALGHIYKKGECIRCGASDPDYSGGEKDAHKIYVSDAAGNITGADTMTAAFRLMKDKNAAYTVFVTENVTESALTFPTVSSITFSGTGKLTLAKTLTRLAPHSNLTIDCAISNAAGKSIAITMPAKSTLTVTANADVTLGTITGKSTATLVINADTEVESVTTFGAVTVAKGAALTVNNKMTGVDTLNGAVNFTGYRTTNPVKVTNIGTAEFTLTQGVAGGKSAITPVTVNTVTNGLKLTVVDITGEPVTLENKTVVAKAGSTDDIAEKMTITNTDENGDPLKLTMNGKNVVVTSGKAAQNVLVTGSKGFKAYASDLTDAFTLMTDKKETYTVELLNDVTESKLTFPTCAGLVLTGEGTLTLSGTTAKLAANSSLTIDCEVVNDKKKAIAVSVPAKATFTLTENAEIKLGTLTGKSNSTLLIPSDLTVESVSTFGSVTVADGATLTVTKKLASIGTLNGNVALTGFKSMNSAKITTVGTASITLPMGKVSGKNAVAKVTVSKITNGLTLNIVDAKGKPVELETGMTVAYAGTKTDISDKITLNAVGTYTLSQSDKEIVAIAEGAKALLELDGVEYYKWGDVVKAMTDKKKDYTLRLLGDYDIGAKLTLPLHSKYKSLTIDGNGYTLTFVGTTVTLTNDTTLKNLTLTALNSSGKAVRYTISKKNYNLTEENVNYGLGTVK